MMMKNLSVFLVLVVVVGGCGEVAEKPSDDVLVNDPSLDSGNNTTQSETAITRYGDIVVIGYNDSGEFNRARSMTGYAYSLDGGKTFSDAGVLKPAGGGQNLGDAALAVDRDGNIYFATLALDDRARSYVGVARSTRTDGAVEFSEPVLIPGTDPNAFQDKELIAVDASGDRLASINIFASFVYERSGDDWSVAYEDAGDGLGVTLDDDLFGTALNIPSFHVEVAFLRYDVR